MSEQDPIFWEWLRNKVRENQKKEAEIQPLQLEIPLPPSSHSTENVVEDENRDTKIDYTIEQSLDTNEIKYDFI